MRPPRVALHTLSLALSLAAALAAAASLAAADKTPVRNETTSFPLEGTRSVSLDLPVGSVRVAPGAADQVGTRLEVRCAANSTSCQQRARDLHLLPGRTSDGLALKVDGWDHSSRGIHQPQVVLDVTVPAAATLRVQIGVGEIDLRGLEGDVSAEVGVGEARVEIPEGAVHGVSVEVGVGEATLVPRPEESKKTGFLFLGNQVSWNDGTGHSHVSVEVGVGDATVKLVPSAAPPPAPTPPPPGGRR
jgi:hypothetical protein